MNIIIQKELPEHYLAVHEILITCFKSDAESKLVAVLRNKTIKRSCLWLRYKMQKLLVM